jgi:hypothetical protein
MVWNAFLFARVSWRHLAINVVRKICKTKAHANLSGMVDSRFPPARNPESRTHYFAVFLS